MPGLGVEGDAAPEREQAGGLFGDVLEGDDVRAAVALWLHARQKEPTALNIPEPRSLADPAHGGAVVEPAGLSQPAHASSAPSRQAGHSGLNGTPTPSRSSVSRPWRQGAGTRTPLPGRVPAHSRHWPARALAVRIGPAQARQVRTPSPRSSLRMLLLHGSRRRRDCRGRHGERVKPVREARPGPSGAPFGRREVRLGRSSCRIAVAIRQWEHARHPPTWTWCPSWAGTASAAAQLARWPRRSEKKLPGQQGTRCREADKGQTA